MATRTVTVLFYNNTTNSLTLTSSSTQGNWITPPPSSIPALYTAFDASSANAEVAAQTNALNSVEQVGPKNWKNDSMGNPPNASGTVTYQLNGTSLYLTLTWNSIEGKPNTYTYNAPTGYNVGVSGSGDVNATVTYTFMTPA